MHRKLLPSRSLALASFLMSSAASSSVLCISSPASASGAATACVSTESGSLTNMTATVVGVGSDTWYLDGTTGLSDPCSSPLTVTVVAAQPTFVLIQTSCIAELATGNVTVTHEIEYSLDQPPKRTSAGSMALALRISSRSWVSAGTITSAGVRSLDSSLKLIGATPATHCQYVPYGHSSGQPISDTGGFYSCFPPGTGTFDYGASSAYSMVIPLSTLYPLNDSGSSAGLGLTFALAPGGLNGGGDPLPPVLTGTTTTDASGVQFTFARSSLGLQGPGAAFTATAYVVVGAPDWRPALDWFVSSWPAMFEPSANVSTLWGAMQYADYRGQALNASLLRDALGLRLNWDATFAFPFWGAWAGPLDADGGAWEDCVAVGHVDPYSGVPHPEQDGTRPPPGVPVYPGTGGCTSHSLPLVASWYAALEAAAGVRSLTYANLFEWGFALDVPAPSCSPTNATAYCAANALYRGPGGFSVAYVSDADYTTPKDWDGSRWLAGWPIAPGVKLLDAAMEPYRSYVLASLAAQLDAGGSAGFCVDRMDHTGAFNRNRDDGIAWVSGAPAAWLGASFVAVTGDMLAGAHADGLAGFVSLLNPRIDLVGGFDGFLNEYGDVHSAAYGLLGLAKPTSGWYWWNHTSGALSPEIYLRQCLVAGQSPMVPWSLSDHGAVPNDGFNADPTPVYLAYAPLYSLLVRKRWLLTPGAVFLAPGNSSTLWANAMDVDVGLILPVVDASSSDSGLTAVSLTTNVGSGRGALYGAYALYPGGVNASVTARELAPDVYAFDSVPLLRGTVVLQLVFAGATAA